MDDDNLPVATLSGVDLPKYDRETRCYEVDGDLIPADELRNFHTTRNFVKKSPYLGK